MGIDTSVWFLATEPESGIKMRWSFNIEPRSANGKGTYYIDVEGCQRVLNLLPEPSKTQFRKYLVKCANEIQKQVDELLTHVDRERITIAALRSV